MTEEQTQHISDDPEDIGYQQQRDPFTRDDLNNADRLRGTNFKQPLHETVNKANIYQSAKRALHTVIDDYFADNRFLTNTTSSGKGKDHILGINLDLERSLIFMTASLCPTDLKNPDYSNARIAIISHNRPVTQRTFGADRERRLQGKTQIASEQTITRTDNISNQPQAQQKKSGFLSSLFGGK